MDEKYFKEQISEELDGAKCYIKKAIDLKPMAPSWSKMLAEMSSAELKHAEYLRQMFNEYYQKITQAYKIIPLYIHEGYKHTMDMYDEEVPKIKAMHEMFNQ